MNLVYESLIMFTNTCSSVSISIEDNSLNKQKLMTNLSITVPCDML